MTQFLIKLFVKNHTDVKDTAVRYRYGLLGSIAGICCNVILFAIKLFAGIISGSISIIADSLNNLSDMGSSVVTLLGIKLANKPADKEHPFGHGRMEYMSAFVVATLILLMGFELLKSSIQKISSPQALELSIITFVILGVSVLMKLWMFIFNRKLSKIMDSYALKATASDCLNDAITTLAIMASMAIQYFFDINLDPYTGIAISLFILYSGYNVSREALDPLLGAPPEQSLIDGIEQTVMSFDSFVGIHDLIVHNYGPGRCFASVHVEVPQHNDMVYCHEQIDLCERLVNEKLAVELVIHMDPIDTNNEALSKAKAEIEKKIKEFNPDMSIHDFRMTPKGKTRTNLIFDVVVPADFSMPNDEFFQLINGMATEIDSTYCCVINVDRNFTGK
ncbi:MAG: cation transporter [Clostridia bacterium]|nr:cation transporter [Clostridia bacterium]